MKDDKDNTTSIIPINHTLTSFILKITFMITNVPVRLEQIGKKTNILTPPHLHPVVPLLVKGTFYSNIESVLNIFMREFLITNWLLLLFRKILTACLQGREFQRKYKVYLLSNSSLNHKIFLASSLIHNFSFPKNNFET